MKKIYIHIGTGKTGTSSIQNFLFDHSGNEFLYMSSYLRQDSHFGETIKAHYDLPEAIKHRNIDKLLQEIDNSEHNLFVISCENLYHQLSEEDIAFLANQLSKYDVDIICYIRRQDGYVESAYKQQVKVGDFGFEFSGFLHGHIHDNEQRHANYFNMLEPWSQCFKNMVVRKFERSAFINNDLIDDFLHCLNVKLNKKVSKKEVNIALSIKVLACVRIMNKRKLVKREDQERFVLSLSSLISDSNRRETIISFEERNKLISGYAKSNRDLYGKYKLDEFAAIGDDSYGYYVNIDDYRKESSELLADFILNNQ